jgi:hypothetical protein
MRKHGGEYFAVSENIKHGERDKPPEMTGFSASASQTIIVDKIV